MVDNKLFLGIGGAVAVIVLGALFVYLDPFEKEIGMEVTIDSPSGDEGILDTEPAVDNPEEPIPGYGDPGESAEEDQVTVPVGGGGTAKDESSSSGGSDGPITIQEDNYIGCVDLFNESTYQGKVVNNSGTYDVNESIVLCPKVYNIDDSPAMEFVAGAVVIDCNGSKITGSGAYGVYNTQSGCELKNCWIDGQSTGIRSTGTTNGFLIDNSNITDHTTGYYHQSDFVTVRNSRFEDIVTRGIYVQSGSDFNFTDNIFVDSGGVTGWGSIYLHPDNNADGLVTDNVFYGELKGDYGINFAGGTTTSYNVMISNNSFYNLTNAIFSMGKDIEIRNNTCSGNGRCVWLDRATNQIIVGNKMNNNHIAGLNMQFYYVSNNFYLDNTIENNTVDGQDWYYIIGESNKVYSGLNLDAENASSRGWVNIVYSDNITLKDSVLSNNQGGYGIWVINSSNVRIENVSVDDSKEGIRIEDGSGNMNITNCSVANSNYGIRLWDEGDNTGLIVTNVLIENNSITGSSLDGVRIETRINSNLGAVEDTVIRNNYIENDESARPGNCINNNVRNASNLDIISNTIVGCQDGYEESGYAWGTELINNTMRNFTLSAIKFDGYDRISGGDLALNVVEGNIITCTPVGSNFGVYVEHDNNTIQHNVIKECYYGVYMLNEGALYPDNNTIYNNYIECSNTCAHDTGSDNKWNLSKTLGNNIYNITSGGRGGIWLGGNYYSDYPALDGNGDGFGDEIHNITGTGGAKDYLPLMPIAYSFYNVPAPFIPTDTNGTNKTSGVDKFDDNEYLQLRKDGAPKADVYCQYEQGDCFLDGVVITEVEPNTRDAAQIVAVNLSGVNSSHNLASNLLTIYIDASWGAGGYVCRGAATVGQVTPNCANVDTFTHAQAAVNYTHPVGNWTVRLISYNGDDYYKVEDLHGTGVASFGNANLTINDSVEGSYGNISDKIEFFAYYINRTSGEFLNGSSCNITFSDNPGVWFVMDEDTGDSRYNYTKSFAWDSTFDWNVSCAKVGYTPLTTNDTVMIGTPAIPAAVPEWSDYALVLILVTVVGGFYYIRKREE